MRDLLSLAQIQMNYFNIMEYKKNGQIVSFLRTLRRLKQLFTVHFCNWIKEGGKQERPRAGRD